MYHYKGRLTSLTCITTPEVAGSRSVPVSSKRGTRPFAEATKRGLGSALLRKPPKLARLVAGIAEGIELPLTVKVRTGTSYSKINAQEVGLPYPCHNPSMIHRPVSNIQCRGQLLHAHHDVMHIHQVLHLPALVYEGECPVLRRV